MQLWAAIDILGGRVVSLRKGNPSMPMVWDLTPAEAAEKWEMEGADGLHVVDLDRAFGLGSNIEAIGEILSKSGIPVQVGGGIRNGEDAQQFIESGGRRVVVGTMAFAHPEMLKQLVARAGAGSVVVALDYNKQGVLTHGWRQSSGTDLNGAIAHVRGLGITRVVMTAVDRDGTAVGPDIDTYRRLSELRGLGILASGGIRSNSDVEDLGKLGLEGAILGRGIYDGSVRMSELGSLPR